MEPGTNTTFVAIVPSDATGTVVFKINNEIISNNITINSTLLTYTYEVPEYYNDPTYNLTLSYSGDSKYKPVNVSTLIALTSEETNVDPQITVDNITVKYLSQTQIVAHMAPDVKGVVEFRLNKTKLATIEIVNGTATYNFNANATRLPGVYRLQVIYAGNYKYSNSTVRSRLTILKLNANLTTENIISKAGSNTTFTSRVIDELGRPVSNALVVYKINQNTIGNITTNETGYAVYHYVLPYQFDDQEYSVQAVLRETSTVNSTRTNATLKLTQLSTRVEVPKISAKINDTVTITATVIDENGNNVLKGVVLFKINGVTTVRKNVSIGHALYTYVPKVNSAKIYNITCIYQGYWKYADSQNNGKLTINKIGTVTTARYVDAKIGKKVVLSASVKDKNQLNVNGGYVRFTLNGKDVGKVAVKNGAANLTYYVGIMKQGAYRLNATYLGSNAYYSSYNLNYMNVTRLNARMVSDAVYVTIGKTAKITVTILDETNHHAENGTVTFTLNGTTIGKATVKKGVASISYRPPNKYNGLTLKYLAKLQANQYYSSAYTINNLTVSSLSTVFVSPKGSDSNIGDKYHPFRTVSYAVGHVSTYGSVILTNGTYSASNIYLNKTIKIIGSGTKTFITGNGKGPIFTVTTNNTHITIKSLTIKNGKSSANRSAGAIVSYGKLNITGVKFINNTATGAYSGGAIYSLGILNLTGVTFTNNAVSNSNGEGGALRLINNTTNINRAWFTGNTAKGTNSTGGGAIYMQDGDLVINSASFNNNRATGKMVLGGAIKAAYGDIVITSSTFLNNYVSGTNIGIGGAINSLGAGLYINKTKFQSNKAYGNTVAGAGAMYIQYAASDIYNTNFTSNLAKSKSVIGGAIEEYYAYSKFVNCIFNSNTLTATQKTSFGGAIYFETGNLTVLKCKFNKNTVTSKNTSIGGAIYTSSNATITNCDFTSNKVTGKYIGGGAIANMNKITISRTNFISNNATGVGNSITAISGSRNSIQNNYWGSKKPTWSKELRGVTKPSKFATTKFSH